MCNVGPKPTLDARVATGGLWREVQTPALKSNYMEHMYVSSAVQETVACLLCDHQAYVPQAVATKFCMQIQLGIIYVPYIIFHHSIQTGSLIYNHSSINLSKVFVKTNYFMVTVNK